MELMKKTLALLIGVGFITMAATCKDATAENPQTDTTSGAQAQNSSQKPEDLATLCTEYSKLTTVGDQILWIQNHINVICDGSLSDCLLSRHSVTEQTYNDMKKAYWDNAIPATVTIQWSEIEPNITTNNCLQKKYVGFTIKDHKVDKLMLYDQYRLNESCYSIALFQAIKKKYGLNSNDNFEFVLGKKEKTSNKIEVLFKVKGKHYDLTVDPLK